jgi:hypothetical protein
LTAGALLAAAATSLTFGSTLNGPPTSSDPPATCDTSGVTNQDIGPCTRVAIGYAATGAVAGAVRAPMSGVIRRVRIRAGTPGALRVTLVRVRNLDKPGGEGEAQAVSRGALLRVQAERPSRPIESFPVSLKVHRGDYLALQGTSISAMRCQGGDTEQLLYFPPLKPFGEWGSAGGFDDCTLLVQATVTKPAPKPKPKKAKAKKASAASEPQVAVHVVDTTLASVRKRGALRMHVATDEPIVIGMTVRSGKTTFAVARTRVGAEGKTVALKLSTAGRKLARSRRALKLTLSARASDGSSKVKTKGTFSLG